MHSSSIITFIFTIFLFSMTYGAPCSSNPCQLGGFYSAQNGYSCYDIDGVNALCTCPGGSEQNVPCRPCSRTNPLLNACQNTNGRLVACIETNDFGTSFACLCQDGAGNIVPTTSANCDTTVTLTTRATTTTATAASLQCLNGAVFYNSQCYCPSGFSGTTCAVKNDVNLCDRIICKNNGTCAIRNTNGPYEGVCLCRYGTFGDYCELIGTLGYCNTGSCLNGGACRENVIGSARHAYCYCQPGYNGAKCENRYFTCPGVGKFADYTMFEQGKYFDCINVGGTIQLTQKSCPKGLRFNGNAQLCTY